MKPVEIKILMMRAGVTQTKIAEQLGITVPFVNQIISGIRPTKYIREAIAEAVGKPVEKLWSEESPNKAA
jgi:transcriptional regulator with XRE-family HTH domain